MPGEHREKPRGAPPTAGPKVIYPSGVRRRWVVILVVVATAAVLAVVLTSRGGSTPRPARVTPSQQVDDYADLMRRLYRHKLVQRSK